MWPLHPNSTLVLPTNAAVTAATTACTPLYISEEAVKRVRKLAGCGEDRLRFFNVDICDAKALRAALEAGPDFVGESHIHIYTCLYTC
jgi:hypothetical protein